MKSVAVLYIGIGDYICFWKGFYISAERYFLSDTLKEYYVFTDQANIYADDMENVHIIYQENLGWPKNTFYRFSFFNSIKEKLLEHDYVFFMNANVYCNQTITEEEFLPTTEKYVFVLHHAFERSANNDYPYERNEKSEAYIPIGKGEWYITGGVNGGKAQAFVELSLRMEELIKEDEANGIIAIWHDESFINKYALGRDDCKILSASYFYPELLNSTELLHDRKIVARDKRKYFDVAKVKNNEDKTLIGDNKQLMDAHYYKLSLKWLFLESKNISVLEFVKNYSNVAIYSYHNLGEILINKLEANKLDNLINCILDPEPEKYNGKYPVCKPYEFGDDVDLIIVTETYRYSEIMTDISMFSNIEIKSIEDIINELLMKYKLQINTKLW